MIVAVCLKQVPNTDTNIRVQPDGSGIQEDGINWVTNPYDEFALEAGIQLKEKKIATEVVVVTMGDASSDKRIREALARGADRAVRLDDPAFAGSDSLGKARILAAAVKHVGAGLVLCGKQAIDTDNSQVPAMIAELLDWPQVSSIDALELSGSEAVCRRNMDGGVAHRVQVSLPAVLSCDKGLNKPRFPNMRGIMTAKRKKLDKLGAGELGLDPSTVGSAGAVVVEDQVQPPAARPQGRIIEGDSVEAKVKELVRLLREEAKVI